MISKFLFVPLVIFVSVLFPLEPLTAQSDILHEVTFERLAENLLRPIGIVDPGDGSGRLFIHLQDGEIRIYDGERTLNKPFIDLTPKVSCCGERGLLGLAFHPDYEDNGFFYVYYIDRSDEIGSSVVSRFRVSTDDPNAADPDSEKVLLTLDQPHNTHNGGQLQFGSDGYLYISTGDGGLVVDRESLGEMSPRLDSLFGKILRVDVDSGDPYAIPPDNPFAGRENARGEIWALGLRNPWRFSFDRQTGDMFIADVGANRVEEVDFQPAGSSGGENYGWPSFEGPSCIDQSGSCDDESTVLPISSYSHDLGCSVIGGYRYRGQAVPQLQGVYLYADFCSGRLFAANEVDGLWKEIDRRVTPFAFTSFGEDANGELYFSDMATNTVYRIVSARFSPTLSTFYPSSAVVGGGGFDLTILGANFVPGIEVEWNGVPRRARFIDNQRIRVSVSAADLAAQDSVRVKVIHPRFVGVAGDSEFPVEDAPPVSPAINSGGIVNAASFRGGIPIAPGMIASVFGTDLALRRENPPPAPLPTNLGGTTILFQGFGAPLFFASPLQSNVQVPWELPSETEADVNVRIGPNIGDSVPVAVSRFSPGLFSADASGTGQGAILISGSGAVAAPAESFPNSRPAKRSEFVEIFATGLGGVTNTPETGSAALANPLAETTARPTLTIGGVEARIVFSGLAPGFVGLYQVNAEVPAQAPQGDRVPVVLTIGEVQSNAVTMGVQ